MKEFWNDRFGNTGMIYGSDPNAFFKAKVQELSPGKLLLPAEGEGRNAVFAAGKGWEVQAFDYSEAGRKKAMQLADNKGVNIYYQIAEAQEFECEPESFDSIALIFAHFPPALRQYFHKKVVQWLKPGGVLILEAFHPKQLTYFSGGPKNEDMLYTAEIISSDFQGMKINLLEEQEIVLEEGTFHQGAGFVTRLVATKPKAAGL